MSKTEQPEPGQRRSTPPSTPRGSTDASALPLPEAMRHAGAAYARGEWAQAESICRSILAASPGSFDALTLLGIITARQGLMTQSADLLGRAVTARPHSADAHNNYGNVLRANQRYADALASYARALEIQPTHAEAHHNRGIVLHETGRIDEALGEYARALEIDPNLVDAWVHRAAALQERLRFADALEALERVLVLCPDHAEAHHRRGNVLNALQRFSPAARSYERALALRRDHPEGWNNLGTALFALRRIEPALHCYDRAVMLKPDFAEAHNNRGVALRALGRQAAAVSAFGHAIELRPDHAEAHANLGETLRQLRDFEGAIRSFDRAIALDGGLYSLYGLGLNTRKQICDWTDHDAQVERVARLIQEGHPAASPFAMLSALDSPRLQRQTAESWVQARFATRAPEYPIEPGNRREKLRLGYFSADFHDHATMYLMAELFELHDRSRFHVSAFSFGPDSESVMRRRLLGACDEFVNVRDRSDEEVARLARDRAIDIAVDLKGFTLDSRPGIFAHRAAPIQVQYLGYPGTMGAPFMDYLVADRVLVPAQSRRHYTEKLLYMPGSYQVNDSKRPISDVLFTRRDLGLPDQGFVFCCFNNPWKITPAVFDAWIHILQRVEGSVLWLLEDNPIAAANLRREALQRGVPSERLIFARRTALPDHLARHRCADLFLDTLPYNAHTTASDALWTGLPILTCIGESFVARVAASLLTAVGLPELITESLNEYVELAVVLAREPARLEGLRCRLAARRSTGGLFDAARYARHLEAGYLQMYERYATGKAPDDIHVLAP